MAESLRLQTGKKKIRLHPAVFVILLIVAAGIGYVIGQNGPGKAPQQNCIPQPDFQHFLDSANQVRADYQKCVKDLWDLQFSIKTGGMAVPTNSTAKKNVSSNISK